MRISGGGQPSLSSPTGFGVNEKNPLNVKITLRKTLVNIQKFLRIDNFPKTFKLQSPPPRHSEQNVVEFCNDQHRVRRISVQHFRDIGEFHLPKTLGTYGISSGVLSVDNRKTAFTLAEVLITLAIIGVVAAMTLPAVINSTRAKEFETGLKTAYSIIEQGLRNMQAENGFPPVPSNYPIVGSFYQEYKKYFNKIIDCGYGSPNENYCASRANNGAYNDLTYKTFNGAVNISSSPFDDGQFILPNGMLVMIENPGGSGIYIYISVDINGKKKSPNRLGHDVFTWQLMPNGKLLPMGAPGTSYSVNTYCSASSSNSVNGIACTYKALTEKDYFKNLRK